MIHRLLFLTLFLVTLSLPASAEDSPPACNPVAQLFEKDICREDIADNQNPEQELRRIVWSMALQEKFGKEALSTDEEAVSTMAERLQAALHESHSIEQKIRALLEDALKKNQYTPEDETKIRELLQTVKESIALYAQREAHRNALPEEYRFITQQAAQRMAEMNLRHWVRAKALHHAYGGRGLLRKGQVIPIDAYAALTTYIQEEGGLNILEPTYNEFLTPFQNPQIRDDDQILSPERTASLFSAALPPFEEEKKDRKLRETWEWLESLTVLSRKTP